ncbi:DUF3293 domain-containing protein, partial [Vibrio sp. V39_P1S14PM300]|uniref:DUF3293 domain-containing protein n=1 Tax=Vibrio sp. V39_P1S14PM300 TaxID=1938690 RepID=UPI001F484F08
SVSRAFFPFFSRVDVSGVCDHYRMEPRSQLMSNEYNRIKNNALERRLRHYSYVSVLVGDAQFCWAEESFAAALPLVKALSLGREFAQNAIYYVRDGELLLFSCQGTQKEHLGALTSRCCE